MKVAKNMDSVFANCTSDELDFDLMFDEDDSLIDAVCGVDEAGVPWTGPDPETEYQIDGDSSYSEKDAEGSKDLDIPISGESGKQGPYKGDSAESRAHDVTPGIKKAIGEGYYENDYISDLLNESDEEDDEDSNDGDLDQTEFKEGYEMYNDDYLDDIIESATGYDEVSEAVDTLLAGSIAIDEAFQNSTIMLEDKVLDKSGDKIRKVFTKSIERDGGNPLPDKYQFTTKRYDLNSDGKIAIDPKKVAIGAGAAAATVGGGIAIGKALEKRKQQKQTNNSQNESAEYVFEDGEEKIGTVKKFINFAGDHKKELAVSAGLGAGAMGAGILAAKGIKKARTGASYKNNNTNQNEAFELEIDGQTIPCITESEFSNVDVCMTGDLLESYSIVRDIDRSNNLYNIALESESEKEVPEFPVPRILKIKNKKFNDEHPNAEFKKVEPKKSLKDTISNGFGKIKDGLGTKKGKIIAGVAAASAAAAGAGVAVHKHKQKQNNRSQSQNESVVYYSAYETYYDEATDELTLVVTPPVAKLEGAKLGLAGEVIPVSEDVSYLEDYDTVMESFRSEYEEILDEDYIFVTEGIDFSKCKPSEIKKAISAMAQAGAKYFEEDKAVRISAMVAAAAAVFGGGAVVGKVMTKKRYEKEKAQNESVDAALDDIIESTLYEADNQAKKNILSRGLEFLAGKVDAAMTKAKNMSKNEKIACGIAAGLSALGVATPVIVKKVRKHRGSDSSNFRTNPDDISYEESVDYALDDIVEGVSDPF